MRIYLAARYSRHDEMQEHARTLEDAGHTVMSRWIAGNHALDAERFADTERFAIEDIEDLTKSDAVISFSEDLDSKPKRPSKGGRHVEFGMAIALNKRVILIGPREHVFHYLPIVEHYEDLASFLSANEQEDM